ncbi:cytochrome c1 [Sphingomonas sp.]|uniref:cytochrome c1 n=1 Tax=Sphingomonas sp. TaxID=28214 RepID=UPI0025FFFCA0|nr:cytochrome c1 [Sphingomonas sp.]MBV9526964.1 cytochrome c1 [Sphingomonas sp.]
MLLRWILGFIGAIFAAVLVLSFFSGIITYVQNPPAPLASSVFHKEPKELSLSSDGPFGTFDKQQLQRGLQVYTEVCSACHSLKLVSFRDLKGLGYTDAEIKAYAGSGKQWKIETPSINPQTGEATTRKGLPSDNFPPPFANEVAARAANNNALPPDLSLITKSREGGAAYVYSLLTGFQNQPAALLKQFPDAKTPPNLHYNPYFANLNIAMPPPLTTDGQVTYADGTKPTVDQMARDVAAFLVWTAEPNLEARHAAGVAVAIFLLIGSILGYLAYQQVWAEAKRKVRVTGVLEPENQAKSRRAKAKQGIAG